MFRVQLDNHFAVYLFFLQHVGQNDYHLHQKHLFFDFKDFF